MAQIPEVDLFDECVSRIEAGYHDLGHQLGWQFLYTSKRTFSRNAPLWFIGLNPGGAEHRDPVRSFEEGNAYRVDRWGGRGKGGSLPGPNPLQRQIIRLFQHIAEKSGADHVELMDSTLTANFCPFRSPSWNALANRKETLCLSKKLWGDISKSLLPRAIVTISTQATTGLVQSLDGIGYTVKNRDRIFVGWGKISGEKIKLSNGTGEILIVRFPHFSRFPIIGRPESDDAVCILVDEIVSAIES